MAERIRVTSLMGAEGFRLRQYQFCTTPVQGNSVSNRNHICNQNYPSVSVFRRERLLAKVGEAFLRRNRAMSEFGAHTFEFPRFFLFVTSRMRPHVESPDFR